jgi:metal-dependent amidase/aminoacylase/carboxypeptidase family protein
VRYQPSDVSDARDVARKRPQITTTEHYPLTVNDPAQTMRVAAALRAQFGNDRVHELDAPVSAGEDLGHPPPQSRPASKR